MKSNEAELSLKERINQGLAKNWKTVVIAIGAAAVVMIGILVIDAVQKKRVIESAMLSEDIQDAYIDWLRTSEDSRDDAELTGLIEKALSEFPQKFAAQRAYFTRGLVAMENEAWDDAAMAFNTVADKWKSSYLAPVSLFNAGSALEESGDLDGAQAAWDRIVNEYSDVAPDAPEALFNLARISETGGDTEKAIDLYKKLGSSFPNSRWTDLGKSRILVLENRG